MSEKGRYDAIVVGSGIVGLAHAYWLSKMGKKVLVIEKDSSCFGASVRNFGFYWPVGQRRPENYELAKESGKVWKEFFKDTDTWHRSSGSLMLAYGDDEIQLVKEYFELNKEKDYHLLSVQQISQWLPRVNAENLSGGLYSKEEITINSRETIPLLTNWLNQKYKVEFQYNCIAHDINNNQIKTTLGNFEADFFVIASGAEIGLFYPSLYKALGVKKCKLQMLRTNKVVSGLPDDQPSLLGATSFIHYPSFEKCPSLDAVREKIQSEHPGFIKYGINLLVGRNNYNELILGDSHEYVDEVSPFDNEEIYKLIEEGIKGYYTLHDISIKERWAGIYTKATGRDYLVHQDENVMVINALAGSGMTISFGLAEKNIKALIQQEVPAV